MGIFITQNKIWKLLKSFEYYKEFPKLKTAKSDLLWGNGRLHAVQYGADDSLPQAGSGDGDKGGDSCQHLRPDRCAVLPQTKVVLQKPRFLRSPFLFLLADFECTVKRARPELTSQAAETRGYTLVQNETPIGATARQKAAGRKKTEAANPQIHPHRRQRTCGAAPTEPDP